MTHIVAQNDDDDYDDDDDDDDDDDYGEMKRRDCFPRSALRRFETAISAENIYREIQPAGSHRVFFFLSVATVYANSMLNTFTFQMWVISLILLYPCNYLNLLHWHNYTSEFNGWN